jgi:asparagine synthase (glutamine-hydrolysing)
MLRAVKQEVGKVLYGALLSPTAKAIQRDRLTFLSAEKLYSLERECRRIERAHIGGDFVEFGVALGGSAIVLATLMGSSRRFHGFDVFGMIPPPTSEKDDEESRKRYEVIQSGRARGVGREPYYGYRNDLLEAVTKHLADYSVRVDQERVSLHKGLFEHTWPAVSGSVRQIGVAHIDCDWYDPVRYCLDAVAEKLAPGGAVILDDYNFYRGCRVATNEFLQSRDDFRIARNAGHLIIRKTVARRQ